MASCMSNVCGRDAALRVACSCARARQTKSGNGVGVGVVDGRRRRARARAPSSQRRGGPTSLRRSIASAPRLDHVPPLVLRASFWQQQRRRISTLLIHQSKRLRCAGPRALRAPPQPTRAPCRAPTCPVPDRAALSTRSLARSSASSSIPSAAAPRPRAPHQQHQQQQQHQHNPYRRRTCTGGAPPLSHAAAAWRPAAATTTATPTPRPQSPRPPARSPSPTAASSPCRARPPTSPPSWPRSRRLRPRAPILWSCASTSWPNSTRQGTSTRFSTPPKRAACPSSSPVARPGKEAGGRAGSRSGWRRSSWRR